MRTYCMCLHLKYRAEPWKTTLNKQPTFPALAHQEISEQTPRLPLREHGLLEQAPVQLAAHRQLQHQDGSLGGLEEAVQLDDVPVPNLLQNRDLDKF